MQATTLVVGSYAPIPGHGAAVTLGATRRAYQAGQDVVVVAPRLGAAHRCLPIEGPGAGPLLDRARREHGASQVVLCAEAGLPVPVGGARSRQLATVSGLVEAFARFERVTVVVSGDLGIPPDVLVPLWSHVHEVLYDGGPGGADRLAVAAVLGLDPQRLRGVPPRLVTAADRGGEGHPEVAILGQARVARMAAQAGAGRPAEVTLFGPPEVTLRERPRQVISVTARAVLGPAAPVVRRGVVAVVRRTRRP